MGSDSHRRRRRRRNVPPPVSRGRLEWGLAAVCLGAVLAVGAVPVQVTMVVCALAFALGTFALRRRPMPEPSWVLAAFAAFTVLQALPLPRALVATIAPRNLHAWDRALGALDGAVPAWAPVSLDPGATWVEAMKWLAYAALFAAGAETGRRRGASFAAWLAFGCALAVALVTLLHGLANATLLYGIYKPTFATPRWGLAPLLNTNNLAGYLNFGVLAGLAVALATTRPAQRVGAALGIALLLGVAVLAASRGALFVLPIALGALVIGTWRLERRRFGTKLLVLAGTLVGGLLLATLAATKQTWSEILQQGTEKLQLVAWARPLIADHPWFGVGRGAFETVFPAYGTPDRNLVYAHAENVAAQWLSEWGIPASLVGIAALVHCLKPRRAFFGSNVHAVGIGSGLVAAVLHNFFDLALEITGYCFLIFSTAGVAWGASAEEPTCRARHRAAFTFGAAGLAVTIGAVLLGRQPAQLDRNELADAFARNDAELTQRLRAAIRRHPADPYFPRLLAATLFRSGRGNPLPWLGLALERDLTSGRSHYLLARVLRSRGATAQALMELRLAVINEPGLAQGAAWLAVSWTRDEIELERAVPPDADGAPVYYHLAAALDRPAERASRIAFFKHATERSPSWVEARMSLGNELVRALRDAMPPCDGERAKRCTEQVEAQATALHALAPERILALELRAALLVVAGKPEQALSLLDRACGGHAEAVGCQKVRVRAAAAVSHDKLNRALDALMTAACPPAPACAEAGQWAGDFLMARGDPTGATVYYRKACDQRLAEGCLEALARAASQAGLHAEAVAALERIGRLRGKDGALRARIEAERSRALTRSVVVPKNK